jgi:hypothetical protein
VSADAARGLGPVKELKFAQAPPGVRSWNTFLLTGFKKNRGTLKSAENVHDHAVALALDCDSVRD